MKKIILIGIVFLLLLSCVSASFSNDRTKYYFDGTNYLTDSITGTDTSINGTSESHLLSLGDAGWAITSGVVDYSVVQSIEGSLSTKVTINDNYNYEIPNNASWTGIAGISLYVTGAPQLIHMRILDDDELKTDMYFDTRQVGAARWRWEDSTSAGACNDAPPITPGWYNLTFNDTGVNIDGRINGKLCKTFAGHSGLSVFRVYSTTVTGTSYVDAMYITNNERPLLGPSGATILMQNTTYINTTKTPVNIGFNVTSISQDNCSLIVNNTLHSTINDVNFDTNSILQYSGVNGFYNYTISCFNETTETTSDLKYFYVDSFPPVIDTLYPKEDGTTTFLYNETFSINSTFSDNLGLYSYNVSIYEGLTQVFSEYSLITGTSYDYDRVINHNNFSNTTLDLQIKVCDFHTKEEIPPYDVGQWDGEKLTLAWGNDVIEIIALDDYIDEIELEYELDDDRVKFKVTYDTYTAVKKFKILKENAVYLQTSPFKGHFVFFNKYWLDFEQEGGHVTVGTDLNGDYIVSVYNDNNVIIFESVGFLNCVTETYNFEKLAVLPIVEEQIYDIGLIPDDTFNKDVLDATTISGALMYFFLIFIYIGLIVFAFVTNIPVADFLAGLCGLFVGILLFASISSIIGSIVVLTGLLFIYRGFV